MTSFFDRMRTIDPNYGNADHQTLFMHRMIELDRRYPCKRDHTSSAQCSTKDHAMNDARRHPSGEHSVCCYTEKQLMEVYTWQKAILAKKAESTK